ncbi:MAG: FadR/GntR family transcriptional regulator [Synergistales bacterium]|jgi:GntR family transcriptional repressor for pyruvate dehydrogenase complex|nr:FadR/GntR family transcriptional regulator [Synergistales bacterium]
MERAGPDEGIHIDDHTVKGEGSMGKRDSVVNDILSGIRSGDLVENDKLPSERELALRLGVSRVLLREAVVALETLGVVESRERLGIFVREPDLSSVTESLRVMPFWSDRFVPQLMEMRLIIDVHACELAALRRTEKQLEQLRGYFKAFSEASVASIEDAKVSARYEFLIHMLIVEAAHNDILARVYEGLMSLMEKNNEYLHASLTRDMSWENRLIEHHEGILRAIEAQDPEGAARWMRTHLVESRDNYQRILEGRELPFIRPGFPGREA